MVKMEIEDKKLEEIITVVEENLDYEGYCKYSDNCEISGAVSNTSQRVKVKNWIKEIIEGN